MAESQIAKQHLNRLHRRHGPRPARCPQQPIELSMAATHERGLHENVRVHDRANAGGRAVANHDHSVQRSLSRRANEAKHAPAQKTESATWKRVDTYSEVYLKLTVAARWGKKNTQKAVCTSAIARAQKS